MINSNVIPSVYKIIDREVDLEDEIEEEHENYSHYGPNSEQEEVLFEWSKINEIEELSNPLIYLSEKANLQYINYSPSELFEEVVNTILNSFHISLLNAKFIIKERL